MKLSKETQSVLKNFGMINSNLILHPGSEIATISPGKNIVAKCVVEETFPYDFGIYDVNEFLSVMSLFDQPDLDFNDKFVLVSEGNNSIKYYAAGASILTQTPALKSFPEPDLEFTLTGNTIQHLHKVSSVLKSGDFSVIGKEGKVIAQITDRSNPTSNLYNSVIDDTDKEFCVNFKVENLKMIAGDYKVSIANKKISRFRASNRTLEYYVAIELDSTFNF